MNRSLEEYLLAVIRGHKKGIVAKIVLIICSLLANIFKLVLKIRTKLYELGVKDSTKLDCTVISIGNITAGGTGKTPVAQFLARKFKERGRKPAILNRGYKAEFDGEIGVVSDGRRIKMDSSEAGDEAYMLAKSLPDVPVIIGSERAVTGKYAYQKFDSDMVILDDGFQHWGLERNLDIVVVDATNPFDNGYLMPRGTLREPLSNLARADVFFLTKVNQISKSQLKGIKSKLTEYNSTALVFETIHSPTYLRSLEDKKRDGSNLDLTGQQVMSLSGIGNPESFEETLSSLGAEVVNKVRFEDHHRYQTEEILDIFSCAAEEGIDLIITTEKDVVSMPPEVENSILKQDIELKVLGIELEVLTEDFELESLLLKLEGKRWKTRR
ncbi:tetraacyldisaccharide 4'-kinase [Sporohalobacter salinus]|uniref:tetraacyldisaccharide 4'-kinase n=1 Tax=Sporohalobacter salinus TaxID=1494606 RepID=UPI0019603865|nr:tetraacyldisaccharide 4'-kinase [Sporohalobacter salinus]MBM7622930.1 tetraacyldisaccharide 4'-kinase [Sporohalobacter salinus]